MCENSGSIHTINDFGCDTKQPAPKTVREVLNERLSAMVRSAATVQNRIDNLPPHMLDMPEHEYEKQYSLYQF